MRTVCVCALSVLNITSDLGSVFYTFMLGNLELREVESLPKVTQLLAVSWTLLLDALLENLSKFVN